jgi:uncharacterized sulfatase
MKVVVIINLLSALILTSAIGNATPSQDESAQATTGEVDSGGPANETSSPIGAMKNRFGEELRARAERLSIKPSADESLLQHTAELIEPRLIKLGDTVHTAIGYDYSNFSFIEGKDGVVVIDTGWFQENVTPAMADYRKITEKPVKGIVYTHTHADHTGACQAVVPADEIGSVKVIGPRGWERNIKYEIASGGKVYRRAFAQFGAMLPFELYGTVSGGIGGPLKPGTSNIAYDVTHEVVKDIETIEVAGTKLVLLNAHQDLPEGLVIYLPDNKTLFVGDLIDGTFVPMATARWEIDRRARTYLKSLELVMEKFPDAEHLVGGHGVVTIGKDNVRQRLQNARDLVKFTADFVEQSVTLGLSPDQILEKIEFPAHLEADPHLQPYYHKLDWIIRGMYTKLGGWRTDINSLTRLTDKEEAMRLIALIGGEKAVLRAGHGAVAAKDYNWAVTLASYLLRINPENEEALELRNDGLLGLAYLTRSANERNYALTEIVDVPWNAILGPMFFEGLNRQPVDVIISGWPLLFDLGGALNETFTVQLNITGEQSAAHYLTFRTGIIDVYSGTATDAEIKLWMDKDTLVRLTSGEYRLKESVDLGKLRVEGNQASVDRLQALQL